MSKMNEDVKALWLTALRSGEYEQGVGALNRGGKFCCLGVLCDLYRIHADPSMEWTEFEKGSGIHNFGETGVSALPPYKVTQWAGMDDSAGFYLPENSMAHVTLAELNDNGATFSEIADVIEKYF